MMLRESNKKTVIVEFSLMVRVNEESHHTVCICHRHEHSFTRAVSHQHLSLLYSGLVEDPATGHFHVEFSSI